MLITVCRLYDLRLRVSELAELVHVNEYLYSEVETDIRKSGEKLFDYVDPKNRAVQIEMEAVCTAYLKRVGGYLAPDLNRSPSMPAVSSRKPPLSSRSATVSVR